MYGLCDCNNYFVSCERVFDPSLCGRAVVVLSSNDGCIVARSNEAKALGIKMGQPVFQIRNLVESGRVIVRSTNFELYGDMSQRVMATLRNMLPSIEVYSIDEAFLDLRGYDLSELRELGLEVSRRVKRDTGIPVSIGIASTKTLAKVASKLCKSYPKLDGCCLMYRPEDITKVLSNYQLGDIWGIGRKSVAKLADYGITTAEQFRTASTSWLRTQMGIVGVRTQAELNGQSVFDFAPSNPDRQSIGVSRSFSHELTDYESLHSSLTTFVTLACEKLRAQSSVTQRITVMLSVNRFRQDIIQYHPSHTILLPTPTDSSFELLHYTTDALKLLYRDGFGYKKAGIVLGDISPRSGVQSSMFDEIDRLKHGAALDVVDRLNSLHGRATVKIGKQQQLLSMTSHDHRSPNYTTDWDDLLTINV